jgi:hypothetical protein
MPRSQQCSAAAAPAVATRNAAPGQLSPPKNISKCGWWCVRAVCAPVCAVGASLDLSKSVGELAWPLLAPVHSRGLCCAVKARVTEMHSESQRQDTD